MNIMRISRFIFFLLFLLAVSALSPLRAVTVDSLAAGFTRPPHSARPNTFWHWINANVTRDGITRDLEAMQQAGVGGVFIFDGSSYMPAGPAAYQSPLWQELMTHAIREGLRLGVDIGMHNAPGWSSSGGPWITPERSMQQLVWTETSAAGGRRIDMPLPEPHRNEGYYRDAFVLAFPSLPGEEKPYEASVKKVTIATGGDVDKALLSDGQFDRGITLSRDNPLLIEFAEPIAVHAVTAAGTQGRRFSSLVLESSDDGVHFTPVCTLSTPAVHGIAAPAAESFPARTARFFRLVPGSACALSEVVLHRTPRIPDWTYKANFAYRVSRPFQLPKTGAVAAIDPSSVIDITKYLDSNGRLRWDAPAGSWTILRIGHTSTGKKNVSASAAGTGLECDKFSTEAVDFQFSQTIQRVLAGAGADFAEGFKNVIIDSYETGMQNWSATFPEEFTRRAGYDIRPYLPALFGRTVGDPAISERFLYDVRRVMADVMTENYYGRMASLCRERGLVYYVEGYGPGMFDELNLSGLPDVPTTEFWVRSPWTPSRTVKMVSSAAHVYGKPVVAAEAFTGEEQTSRWMEYPYAMKVLGDDMFAAGVNHFVFHRYAHQPHPDAAPGVAMGPFGFPFERTNTWFAQSRGWLDYLSRCQQMLRQGAYIADVLYFIGENPPNSSQFLIPSLPAGHNYDLVSAEVLLNRAYVENGTIALPEGGRYRVLMLPPDLKAMTPELMRKLRDLVEQGAVVLGPKPEYSPTLRGYPKSDQEVRRIADALWNGTSRVFVTPGHTIESVFAELDVSPDFEYTGRTTDAELSWQHRKLPDGDLYFIANRQRLDAEVLCSFRTTGRVPELWNPQTGEITSVVIYEQNAAAGRTRLPLRLGPAESMFVVFRKPSTANGETSLARNGEPVTGVDFEKLVLPAVTNDFTMSVWAKPDIDLRLLPRESTTGRVDETAIFYAIPAAEGDMLYGEGHTMAGLAVGRNGAYVIERASGKSPAVVVAQQPVSGWTHFAVVYRGGKPRLYIDGRFVREGQGTGDTVHPGIGSPPPAPDVVYHFEGLAAVMRASGLPQTPSQSRSLQFEGNLTRPELFTEALDDQAIADIAERGLPPTADPYAVELGTRPDGRVCGLFWQSGNYTLSSGTAARVEVAEPILISGPWRVTFQSGRRAPESIGMSALTSLHRHENPGVRHFSGTAAYTRTVNVPAGFIEKGKRVMLDLGRVEVIAEVRVNGRDAGIVWQEPYRIDITDAVHAGDNALEIRVTTLWPNRIIGDEHLPAENEYNTRPSDSSIKRTPDWFAEGREKPGERITFQTWRFFTKDDPLLESGLLGPVRLLNPVSAEFK
jgi:hypothetical protein